MHFQTAHILLLVLTMALSLFVLIAATRYAMWSRVMVVEGSWLGLCAYVGLIPLISLAYTITHLALLHFRVIPSFSPAALARRQLILHRQSHNTSSSTARLPTTTVTMTLLSFTLVHTLAWLAQSALCTACEMAPIAAGTQGLVPRWCPQSRFRDTPGPSPTDSLDRAAMLASLALAKDAINWVIFVAGLCMVECCRRGWKCAQVLEAEGSRAGVVRAYDPGVGRGAAAGWGGDGGVERSWSTKSANGPGPAFTAAYDLGSLPPPQKGWTQGASAKKNSFMGIRAVQTVPVNLNGAHGYATRV